MRNERISANIVFLNMYPTDQFNVAASTANLQRDYPYKLNSGNWTRIQIQTVD